jgi:cytochrome c553
MGVADMPPIAGRSPSYIVRQLWDIQQGTRHGASAQLMKLIVANLTEQDLVSIAAYVASQTPAGAAAPATQTARLRLRRPEATHPRLRQ